MRLQFPLAFTKSDGTFAVPPDVYAPLPAEVFRENRVAFIAVTTHVPFAARFPATPETVTICPVRNPCALAVVITMGLAFVASVIVIEAGTEAARLVFPLARAKNN